MTIQPDDPHALLLELMRQDFTVFLQKAFSWINGGELMMWNWHLDSIAFELERVANRKCRRLLVNMPPRNGKSQAISVAWVAWMLGKDPRLNFVCVSYSNELSFKLARLCLQIMQAPWYRLLFPGTQISKRSAAYDFETTRGGGRLATSITGTLTGRGGDIIILDDVIKPQDADSEVVRSTVNEWYQSTLSSRLNDKRSGAIICVMQRLHQYDLAGLMIETGRYEVLSLQAIATCDEIIKLPRGRTYARRIGEVLHREREPRTVLDELKAEMGSARFAAQFQQSPVPAVGNIIKAAWFRTYMATSLAAGGGQIVQSWDTGNKTNPDCAWSVCVTAVVRGKHVYIIDVYRDRLEFPDLRRKAIALAKAHRATAVLIEDKASGTQLIAELNVPNMLQGTSVLARKVDQDKVSRVEGISAMIEGEQLLFPHDAPWLSEFKAELLAFPNGRFADQVDALTQLLTWVRERQAWKRSPLVGPILFSDGEIIGDVDGIFSDDDCDPYGGGWGAGPSQSDNYGDDPWLPPFK
jgi:predicted phage terminase large subunit-like protein